jgi:hypothetical protein
VKRTIVGILAIPILVVGLALLTAGDRVVNFVLGPDDDPHFFCTGPDPSPFPTISSSSVLQECSAGKTVTIRHGDIIVVDLPSGMCIDTCSTWDDFAISDRSVLRLVSGPAVQQSRTTDESGAVFVRQDEIAEYRALKAGKSTLSAVLTWCTANFGGHCARGHRWRADVTVT